MRSTPRFGAILLCCIAVSTGSAQQEGTRKDSLKNNSLPEFKLNEVVITATRQQESILEIPLAVSVVFREDITSTRMLGLQDALQNLPGVFAQTRSGSTDNRITIRGFGARGNGDRSNAGNLRGIRILRDGIPMTEPDGRTSLDLIDFATTGSMEIVRSNSSALYGGASGGVIQLRSTGFANSFVDLQSTSGDFGLLSNSVTTGFRSGMGSYILSMTNSKFDGWRKHSENYRTIASALAEMSIAPASRLLVMASATTNLMKFPGALTRAEFENTPAISDSTYSARDERRFNRLGRLGVALEHAISDAHHISFMAFVEPKYLQRSERGTFRDFNRYHIGGGGGYAWTTSVSSDAESVLRVGFDEAYQDGSIQFYSLSATNSRGQTLQQNKREGANSFGAYAQEELRIGSFNIAAGVRYDIVHYISEDNISPALNASKDFKTASPKLGITYRLDESHSVYAAFGGGLEAPAFNEIDPPPDLGLDTTTSLNPILDPMKSTTLEAGVKGHEQWRDASFLGSVQYELAVYSITVTNDLVPWNGGRWYFTAGKSHRTGVEAGVQVTSPVGIMLSGVVTAGSAKYDTYVNDIYGDQSGKKVAGIPDLFGGLRLRYTSPWHVYVDADLRHTGEYFAEDRNNDDSHVPSSTIFGAGLGVSVPFSSITLEGLVRVENLTDEAYIGSVFINGAKGRFFEPGLPRNVFGSLRVKWNI